MVKCQGKSEKVEDGRIFSGYFLAVQLHLYRVVLKCIKRSREQSRPPLCRCTSAERLKRLFETKNCA